MPAICERTGRDKPYDKSFGIIWAEPSAPVLVSQRQHSNCSVLYHMSIRQSGDYNCEMSATRSDPKLSVTRFQFSVRLKSIFFPFGVGDIGPGLEQLGYSLDADSSEGLPIPAGTRVVISGEVARKSEPPVSVRIDPQRGILGFHGADIQTVVDDFDKLEVWVNDNLSLALSSEAQFYEFILAAELAVPEGRSPIDTIARVYSDSDYTARFSELLGTPVTNYGVRLVGRDDMPTSLEWIDLRVEPMVRRPTASYSVNAIYRAPDKVKVEGRALAIADLVEKVVEEMEREAE